MPRICLILRKAFGGAYIVMDSRGIGNDICLAWPAAEIAVMGASGAVQILHRGIDPAERAERETGYEEAFLNPWPAVGAGVGGPGDRSGGHPHRALLGAAPARAPNGSSSRAGNTMPGRNSCVSWDDQWIVIISQRI